MSKDKADGISRREMIGSTSLAALGAGLLAQASNGAQQPTAKDPQAKYQVGKDPGKHEPLQDFKFDVEATTGWVGEAGSAKEATVEEFPVSKSIAGVSMRLKPGGIRELHWHAIAAEWAFVVKGKVLTTVISPTGQASTDIFDEGDIWYFPRGHGHALQNISNDEAHFVLGFDDGHFSEFGTFSITDWVARTPANVVQKNLGLSPDVVKGLPTKELYILPGKIPQNIPEPYLAGDLETSQSAHKFRLRQMPAATFEGGWERIVTQHEFPINGSLTSVLQHLNPGAIREMHWHPNADEWQYILQGRSRVTIFGAHGRVKTEEFQKGQICFIERGFGHCVEQIGDGPTEFFALFNSPIFEEISISKWTAGNPASLLADNFQISREQASKLPKGMMGIIR